MREEQVKALVLIVAAFVAVNAFSFQPIPKESAKALGVTRGKSFSSGAVFINGKYIEPPYVVERRGTGIRINSIPVTGQVIDWNEFLKTQSGIKVEKKEAEPAPVQAAPAQPAVQATSTQDEMSSLDDLFDDDPKPKKPAVAKKPVFVPMTPKPAKPTVTYVLEGEFKPNEESKALLKRVNTHRTEIDRTLRTGGFIFFGDSYSYITGDKRTFLRLLESLPELQQRSRTLESFRAGVRAANLVYLNEVLCEELFRNKVDYRKLMERRERVQSNRKWDQIIEEVSDPLF